MLTTGEVSDRVTPSLTWQDDDVLGHGATPSCMGVAGDTCVLLPGVHIVHLQHHSGGGRGRGTSEGGIGGEGPVALMPRQGRKGISDCCAGQVEVVTFTGLVH